MAVAKQQINNERIRNEVKHLVKNRTDDFVQNPMKRKLPTPQPLIDNLTHLFAVLVEFITQKPVHADPRNPSQLKSFYKPSSQDKQGIAYDPKRVDRIFKVKSMQKRIGTAGGVPG